MVALMHNIQKFLYFENFWFWDNCTVIRNTTERPCMPSTQLHLTEQCDNQEMIITPSTNLSFQHFHTHHVCIEFHAVLVTLWMWVTTTAKNRQKVPSTQVLAGPSYSTAHATPLTTALQRVSKTLSCQSDDCVDWLSRIVLRLAVSMWHDSLRSLPDCLVYQQSVVLMFRRKYSESMVWQRLSLTQRQTPSVKGEIGELCITHLCVASIWKPPGHSRSL